MGQNVLEFFAKTQGFSFINMQKLNEINQLLAHSLGICVALCTIKSLRLLRFQRGLAHLGSTIKYCLSELLGLSIFFFVIWISFVQIMFLLHGSHLLGYSTFVKSMLSAFEMMIGKFDATQLVMASPVMGSIVFITYNVVIVFGILNVFISVLTDAYKRVREGMTRKTFDLMDHLIEKFFYSSKMNRNVANDYQDHFSKFGFVMDRLNMFLMRVNKF